MPKTTRKPEEIQEVKERILEEAILLMTEVGFASMSMRKLASRLRMTAANIYNYYSNKDELYLDIQTNGFQMLLDRFTEIDNSLSDPNEKLRKMGESYIQFGIENSNCYDIMFNMNTPKYSDYKNTEIEPVAFHEKQTALKVANLTTKVIQEIIKKNRCFPPNEAAYRTIHLWSSLHGILSLFNSRVLQEVDDYAENIIKKYSEELLEPYK